MSKLKQSAQMSQVITGGRLVKVLELELPLLVRVGMVYDSLKIF